MYVITPEISPRATDQIPVPALLRTAALGRWCSFDLTYLDPTGGLSESDIPHSASVDSPEAVSHPWFEGYVLR